MLECDDSLEDYIYEYMWLCSYPIIYEVSFGSNAYVNVDL